jgi:hypothetical protein
MPHKYMLKPRVPTLVGQVEAWVPVRPLAVKLAPAQVNQGTLAPTAHTLTEQTQNPDTE